MSNIKIKVNKILDFLYRYRYLISICIFVMCVLVKVSGSSIGFWENYIPKDNEFDTTIGVNRGIRSDEWSVLTPMFFNQIENGFNYFNSALRGTLTDVFIVYALPVKTIFQIFRPFSSGFILFGAERGLSFFWCGRLIALFIVSLDFFMILTKKNKPLSFVGATMVTLAPMVQWWFAINGIAEIFIFGELIIIMTYKYLNTNSFKKRLLYLLVTYISAGGYALVFYPSWQIPMAYIFFVLEISIIIENYKNSKIKLKDIISIITMILLLGLSLFLIVNKSIETIKIITNTEYPGARFETGGGQFNYIFSYIISVFLPFKETGLLTNSSEEALMFSLFPIGLILSIRNIIKKEKDVTTTLLLIVYALIGIYCVFGFPKFLAKITFLSNSQSHKTILALGFIDILLLIRSLSIQKESISRKKSIIIAALLSIIFIIKNMMFQKTYLNSVMLICLFVMCLYLFYTVLRYHTKYGKYLFILGITAVMIISGCFVNPIRFGTDEVLINDILINAKNIDKDKKGIWITEGLEFPSNNYITMAGVKTINMTNTYPDLEKWYKIDKDKKYKEIYNRYAHIEIDINDNKEKFELLHRDSFKVNVTNEDLDKLKVNYIFTKNNLETHNDEKYEYKQLYKNKNNDFKIYEFVKK